MVVVARESLKPDVQGQLERYLDVCTTTDARNMHFFDECSVIKTTGNRQYGHAPVGQKAIEIQCYASNATLTVNLLHNVLGFSHVNIIQGPSKGLELLKFFGEAL